jgi:hypothetical protein
MSYQDFVNKKLSLMPPMGLPGPHSLPADMLPHQIDLTRWALKRGRAAIFAEVRVRLVRQTRSLTGK